MSGPIRLREKPHTDWVNREAFDLPEGSDLADFMALAEWVGKRGGEVPYLDENGALVKSNYVDPGPDDDYEPGFQNYYEFVRPPALVVFDPKVGEFADCARSMLHHYRIEAAE